MSTNNPDPDPDSDPLRPPSSGQPTDVTLSVSTAPRNIPASSQNHQYLSNSPLEFRCSVSPLDSRRPSHDRYSTSPLDARCPSHDQRLSASPTAEELYIHGEPFPELSGYPVNVADPSIHIQQPSNEQDELSEMAPSQPTSFAPFFTLITDSTVLIDDKDGNPQTPTTHHPSRIHYIFSDDEDSEVLKDACLRCIPDASSISNSNSFTNKASEELRASNSSSRPGSLKRKESGKDGKENQREERVILIDMNETGDRVVRAQSLSDKWQIMGCEIGKAPIWEGEGNEEKGGGLMLRIEGVMIPILKEDTNLSGSREKGKGKENDDGNEEIEELDMEKLLEGFDKKMNVLRKVIGGVGWDHGHDGGGHAVSNMDGEGEGDGEGEEYIPIQESGVEDMQRDREKDGEAFEAS
ncbi:hypothetical protein SBOR_6471 [Sclerotinia borealis F-4128]|uniref:Uncharacterized protein n=1 Tax=Sclerotinia borealis (strain F-4128) TaxID=1432307 RepID=W9CEB5_SCLBF|nr:hypothetical protein SBOR_6471 [Sclerotinia borealis F-4128]